MSHSHLGLGGLDCRWGEPHRRSATQKMPPKIPNSTRCLIASGSTVTQALRHLLPVPETPRPVNSISNTRAPRERHDGRRRWEALCSYQEMSPCEADTPGLLQASLVCLLTPPNLGGTGPRISKRLWDWPPSTCCECRPRQVHTAGLTHSRS